MVGVAAEQPFGLLNRRRECVERKVDQIRRPTDQQNKAQGLLPVLRRVPLVQSVHAVTDAGRENDAVEKLTMMGVDGRLDNVRQIGRTCCDRGADQRFGRRLTVLVLDHEARRRPRPRRRPAGVLERSTSDDLPELRANDLSPGCESRPEHLAFKKFFAAIHAEIAGI